MGDFGRRLAAMIAGWQKDDDKLLLGIWMRRGSLSPRIRRGLKVFTYRQEIRGRKKKRWTKLPTGI